MTFHSPLLDAENLRLAAEDDPDALVGRVCARRKPVAFVDHRRWRPLVVVRQISLELERLRPMRFSDFLEFRDVEIGMQSRFGEEGYSVYEYARTGLLLGYPVESTCEVMRTMFAERSALSRR